MGAATTHAQEAANAALSTTAGVDLTVATELFQAARALAHRPTLAGALADWAATPESRAKVVEDVFGAAVSPVTRQVLAAAAVERWSSAQLTLDVGARLRVRRGGTGRSCRLQGRAVRRRRG
jgi:F-type H+-transporting ATPase subunit delta